MNSQNKTVLIVVIVLIVVCCLCSLVTAGGAGIYYYSSKPAPGPVNSPVPPSTFNGKGPAPTDEASAPPQEDATETPDASSPNSQADATETPDASASPTDEALVAPSNLGLGVSRDEIIKFFNSGGAFNFAQPTTLSGVEVVQGRHKTLCFSGDCAALTLMGPADDLLGVSVAVHTDPKSKTQTATVVTLVMTLASYFSGGDESYSTAILQKVYDAQAGLNPLNDYSVVNGYTYSLTYYTSSHILALGIARKK